MIKKVNITIEFFIFKLVYVSIQFKQTILNFLTKFA